MSYRIDEIEGIGPAYRGKLSKAKIMTTNDLLRHCCDPKGRKAVSAQTGVSEKLLLEWTNLADLMRVSGIGPQFSELLEAAGVDTVKELRNRKASNLAASMKSTNERKRLARTSPAESRVEDWIKQAKKLTPKIKY